MLQSIRNAPIRNRVREIGVLHRLTQIAMAEKDWKGAIAYADQALNMTLNEEEQQRKKADLKRLKKYRKKAVEKQSKADEKDRSHLPDTPEKIISSLSTVAERLDLEVYAVGGFVRDRLLARPFSGEIDFAVVGDAPAFAAEVAAEHGLKSKIQVFKRFGTARLKMGDIFLEFAGTRRESYNENSRNPKVEPALFEEDLARRDFTINTLAVDVKSPDKIIDHFKVWKIWTTGFSGRRSIRKRHFVMIHCASCVPFVSLLFLISGSKTEHGALSDGREDVFRLLHGNVSTRNSSRSWVPIHRQKGYTSCLTAECWK